MALRNGAALIDRNLQIIRTNLCKLDAFFGAHADLFEWPRSDKAGPVAFPRLIGGEGIEEVRDRLRKAAQVLLRPARCSTIPAATSGSGSGERICPWL